MAPSGSPTYALRTVRDVLDRVVGAPVPVAEKLNLNVPNDDQRRFDAQLQLDAMAIPKPASRAGRRAAGADRDSVLVLVI
jgi:hypothetical protein